MVHGGEEDAHEIRHAHADGSGVDAGMAAQVFPAAQIAVHHQSHIPGAVNIPLSKIRGIGVPKDTPLFIYCLRGTRSLRAARILTRMGYGKARSIGGITAYRGKTEQ